MAFLNTFGYYQAKPPILQNTFLTSGKWGNIYFNDQTHWNWQKWNDSIVKGMEKGKNLAAFLLSSYFPVFPVMKSIILVFKLFQQMHFSAPQEINLDFTIYILKTYFQIGFLKNSLVHFAHSFFEWWNIVWKTSKMSNLNFWFLAVSANFVLLKLICLVTLFDRKLQVFKNSPNWACLAFLMNFCPLKM